MESTQQMDEYSRNTSAVFSVISVMKVLMEFIVTLYTVHFELFRFCLSIFTRNLILHLCKYPSQ